MKALPQTIAFTENKNHWKTQPSKKKKKTNCFPSEITVCEYNPELNAKLSKEPLQIKRIFVFPLPTIEKQKKKKWRWAPFIKNGS